MVNKELYRDDILRYVDMHKRQEFINDVNKMLEDIKKEEFEITDYTDDEYIENNENKTIGEVFKDSDIPEMLKNSYTNNHIDSYSYRHPVSYEDVLSDDINRLCESYVDEWIEENIDELYEIHKDSVDDKDDVRCFLYDDDLVIGFGYEIFSALFPDLNYKLFGDE